jgi:hypothetical protein
MTVNPASINVHLTLFFQGLYTGSGTMNPAQDNAGAHWGASVADKINVELHSSSSYSTIIYTASNVSLSTTGSASFVVPGTYNGSYFITIKNRNSLETVSASAISFASGTVNYDFSDLATRAYGNNLVKMTDNRWVVYSGDVNQDGIINQDDMDLVTSDAAGFFSSYIVTDVNGDGIIDAKDLIIIDDNAASFISKITP